MEAVKSYSLGRISRASTMLVGRINGTYDYGWRGRRICSGGARIEIISNAPKIIKLQLTLCLQQVGSPFPSLLDGFA